LCAVYCATALDYAGIFFMDFCGLLISMLLLVGGFIYFPRFVRRRWPDDWATPLIPLVVLWVIGCVTFFLAYESLRSRV
jgi:hypothetical protein